MQRNMWFGTHCVHIYQCGQECILKTCISLRKASGQWINLGWRGTRVEAFVGVLRKKGIKSVLPGRRPFPWNNWSVMCQRMSPHTMTAREPGLSLSSSSSIFTDHYIFSTLLRVTTRARMKPRGPSELPWDASRTNWELEQLPQALGWSEPPRLTHCITRISAAAAANEM